MQVARLGGLARVAMADPQEIAETRRKGGLMASSTRRGNSDWGRRMALARLRKQVRTIDGRVRSLEGRLGKVEAALRAR